MSIRSMRYCDGQLLEGNGDQYEEKFFWASISNPMFFMWTARRGVARREPPPQRPARLLPAEAEPTEENIALYQKYLPLYAQFRRRVFCFEPDPIRAARGQPRQALHRGRRLRGGHHQPGHRRRRRRSTGPSVRTAHFRVARGHDVTKVGMMLPGRQGVPRGALQVRRHVHPRADGRLHQLRRREAVRHQEDAASPSARTPSPASPASAATRTPPSRISPTARRPVDRYRTHQRAAHREPPSLLPFG